MTKHIVFPHNGNNNEEYDLDLLKRSFNKLAKDLTPFGVYVDEGVSTFGASKVVFQLETPIENRSDTVFVDFNDLFTTSALTEFDTKVAERVELNMLSILSLLLVQNGYMPTFKAMTQTAQECLYDSMLQWSTFVIKSGRCEMCACDLNYPEIAQNKHSVPGFEDKVCYLCVNELVDRLKKAQLHSVPDKEFFTFFQLEYVRRPENESFIDLLKSEYKIRED